MWVIQAYQEGTISYDEFQDFMWGSGQRLIEETGVDQFVFFTGRRRKLLRKKVNNMFDDVNVTHFFKSVYQDRGKQKWAGFYLSEHTEEMAAHDTNQKVVKERLMSPDEINQVLVEAQLKRSYLSVQKEDYTYFRGDLTGFDNESITIDLKTLRYEEIRFVEVVNFEKW